MEPSTWFVIINPNAGNGAALKQWPKIKQLLKSNHYNYGFAFLDNSGHATELVVNAVSKGIYNIICVGGDGTLHAILNGIMLQTKVASSAIRVGIIPIGTGNDWAKNYAIPNSIEAAFQLLKNNSINVQDVGKLEFLDTKKQPIYFSNLAGIGFDGYVSKQTEKLKHLGKFSYLIAACQALLAFKNFEVEILYEGNRIKTKSLMVIVGMCRYSGGGMQLTNNPNPTDGLFDVSNVTNFTAWNFITSLPKLYNGKAATIKKVNTFKTDRLRILTQKRTKGFYMQTDGEVLEAENVAITLVKKAFSFYC